ncbi:MAG: hypothetical protein U5R31_03780 [Acidimicrobiia bacterium]|nr:hypothetical protein [Acidimicrobiia bacterium]
MREWTGHDLASPGQRDVLCSGALEVVGRMPFSSNATFLVEVCGNEGRTASRLQARTRRASAVGLPRRALPPRGGGLRAVAGTGLGCRPHDRRT